MNPGGVEIMHEMLPPLAAGRPILTTMTTLRETMMTMTIGLTITIPNQRTDNGVPVERPVREGASMGQFTMLEEDKAVEEMAVVPSADLAYHQMAEVVPLVEVATEMEIGLGDVPRGPQLEMVVAARLTRATEILSRVYLTELPKTEVMMMDHALFSQ